MKNKKKREAPKLEITELFMAKCGRNGYDRCYYGTISRDRDETGKEISVSGEIYMKDEGYFWAKASNQDELGEMLDSVLELRLDYGLHKDTGVFSDIGEARYCHN